MKEAPMGRKSLVRIRMRGNHLEYEVGREYDVAEDVANQLSGLGMATIVEDTARAAAPDQEEEHV
jgi:hypothetical protein